MLAQPQHVTSISCANLDNVATEESKAEVRYISQRSYSGSSTASGSELANSSDSDNGSDLWVGGSHEQDTTTVRLEQLQQNLEESLQTLAKQQLLASAAADAAAWHHHMWQQELLTDPTAAAEANPYLGAAEAAAWQQQEQMMMWGLGVQLPLPPPGLESPFLEAFMPLPLPLPGFGLERLPFPSPLLPYEAPSNWQQYDFAKTPWVARSDAGGKGSVCAHDSKTSGKTTSTEEGQKEFQKADHCRIVVATKINRLGFNAEKVLKKHFAHFGKIRHVTVPQKVKQHTATMGTPGHSHLRPSGLGFIVMDTEEEVQAILAVGAEHVVFGKMINVRAFKQEEEQK